MKVHLRNFRFGNLFFLLSLCSALATAEPVVSQIGQGLYAYQSDNDASANCTFLVGNAGILVVDTGLNATEGSKLLGAIRRVSALPVKYVVNTHYHPDHQGANTIVGPAATVISTDFTRERTLAIQKDPGMISFQFEPADLTFQQQVTLHLEPYTVQIYFPGKAHTSGDALVYFPEQRTISMGDLFLNRSSPAMDDGSVENWIQALDHVLELPLAHVVPGHFELATKPDLQRFRDYLNDLYEQVRALKQKNETLEQVRHDVHMEKYSDFRQYPRYEATFADNAAVIYQQMQAH
jgi:cyclase